MHILIVGAGLGGLSAAIGFARKGHQVDVFEQRDELFRAGSGLSVRPGASRILHSWGLRPELESFCEDTPAYVFRSMKTGAVATRTVAIDATEDPDWTTHRSVLIGALFRKAKEAGANISFGVTVAKVQDDDRQAVAILRDGTTKAADLILAADGIRSRLRAQILHDLACPRDLVLTDLTLYGMRIPKDEMANIAELQTLIGDAYVNVYMGNDSFVVSRYIEKLQQHTCFFGIRGETDQQGLWDERGDVNYLRNYFKGACAELTKLLEVAKSCDRWKLAEIPDLPRWTSPAGRIALLGDSAQGFSQTVEDIGTLEYLISANPDPNSNITTILEDWQHVRKPRVERIKDWAKFNSAMFIGNPETGPGTSNNDWQVRSLKNIKADMNSPYNSAAFLKWTLNYDAVREYLQSKKSRL
ncbi:hypothetical protein F4780DRAFT_606496 [Xylariomycetidae sp. FL0641]|nr:hypothetical protein F4780DRAFT_606496 [Xylariomycetidae sp. FL0641]